MSSPHPTPAPLDLAQFEGFTPGPWRASFDNDFVESDEGAICEVMPQDMAGDDGEVSEDESRARELNNLELLCAAPALLAECQRQRALIEAMACGIADMLTAWDNATSASVKMRASAIAGLRGIIEHRQPIEAISQREEIARLRGAGMNMLNAAHWLLITPDSHNDQTLLRLSARVMKRVLGVEISDLDSKPDPREVEIARLRAALVATGSRLTTAARAFYGTGTRSALSAAFDGWKADAEAARAALAGQEEA